MLKIKSYVKVNSLEEAYELNQKKTARVLGGMVWMKMWNRNITTAIDLSGLGLNQIQEKEDEFIIGCMTTLRDIETHEGLNSYTNGAVKESVRHIVGVQFRNCATVGGSIFSRFGFSDVMTMFLSLDTYVELYHGGIIPLKEFASMKKDNDILVNIIVKKTPGQVAYQSMRNTSTDFPVLTCAVSYINNKAITVIGARPAAPVIIEDTQNIMENFMEKSAKEKEALINNYSQYVSETVITGSNMRGSKEYRKLLARVLTKRAWEAVGGKYEN